MTIPIKIALLWHQHQPYYKTGNVFQLPWVYLHATKDYLEMAEQLARHPAMHATINLVPSLLEQLDDYCNGVAVDRLLSTIQKPVTKLTTEEQEYLRTYCFHANRGTIIAKSKRYTELLHLLYWSYSQDILDLEVLFLLAWTGELQKQQEPLASLVKQDRDFTEEQKQIVLAEHLKIIRSVIESHKFLAERGQVELSCSPYYHPILPLVCDTNSAREVVADIVLPAYHFSAAEDAREQIIRGLASHERCFGKPSIGMWPSEGSISDEALGIMAESGLTWTASDEGILENSLNHPDAAISTQEFGDLEKYFPRKFTSGEKSIVVFFRDHRLSDKIGFDYQTWKSFDAVSDFIHYVKHIRTQILGRFGEEALRDACITVILDGENCWEFYPNNGNDFLREFYTRLSNDEEIHPVTFTEAIREISPIRPITHIAAGSWINANFKIWIGHSEKNKAWELLTHTKAILRSYRIDNPNYDEAYEKAYTALLKAEGSDWFWWFGEDHFSTDRPIFDELFRSHLKAVYRYLSVDIPPELDEPIVSSQNAGLFGAMHRVKEA